MAHIENFIKNFTATPIAHRGLHDDKIDENSMTAFRLAIENNYGIETDVHLLADGVVAVHHDSSLKRVCGADIKIESLTSAQLKDYPLKKTGEIIPTLPELLALVDGKVPLLIELKGVLGVFSKKLGKSVLRDLKNYKYKDMIALQSFDCFMMKWIGKNQSDFPYGQLASKGDIAKPKASILMDFIGKLHCAKISKPEFIAYDILSTPNKYIQKYLDSGTPVLSWTVNTPEKLELAKKYTNNVIFEKIRP